MQRCQGVQYQIHIHKIIDFIRTMSLWHRYIDKACPFYLTWKEKDERQCHFGKLSYYILNQSIWTSTLHFQAIIVSWIKTPGFRSKTF